MSALNNQLALSSQDSSALQDQRDFIKAYVEDFLQPHGEQPSAEEVEEMESVLYSVSFGK